MYGSLSADTAGAPADWSDTAFSRREVFSIVALLAAALVTRVAFVLHTREGTPLFDKYFWLSEKLAAAGWLPDVVFGDGAFAVVWMDAPRRRVEGALGSCP